MNEIQTSTYAHVDTPIGQPGRIRTFTGRLVDPWALLPEDIFIEDIAHSLSQQCRFTGHTRRFYSVAEHCLLVAAILSETNFSRRIILGGLIHDAGEAYFGDMAGPSKRRPSMHEYDIAEHIAADTIMLKLVGELTERERHLIKQADAQAYHIEKHQLMRQGVMGDYGADLTYNLGRMSMEEIEESYLELYLYLIH